jgi:hypothetical protein
MMEREDNRPKTNKASTRVHFDTELSNKEKQKMTHDWVHHTSPVNIVLTGQYGIKYHSKPVTPVYTRLNESEPYVCPEGKAIRQYQHADQHL